MTILPPAPVAMAMLKRVGSQCGEPEQLIHIMWRFDVLADADYFDSAVREALTADIIVIATREGCVLPYLKKLAHYGKMAKRRSSPSFFRVEKQKTPR
jgi:hypothetical protein